MQLHHYLVLFIEQYTCYCNGQGILKVFFISFRNNNFLGTVWCITTKSVTIVLASQSFKTYYSISYFVLLSDIQFEGMIFIELAEPSILAIY